MTNYKIRIYQSQKDNMHHLDIYADEKIQSKYFYDGKCWFNEETRKGNPNWNQQDIIEEEIYGDLDEYKIEEQNAYGSKYIYYTQK